MTTSRDLRQQKAKLLVEARRFWEEAEASAKKDNREVRAEDNSQYDEIFAQITALDERIAKLEKLEEIEQQATDAVAVASRSRVSQPIEIATANANAPSDYRSTPEYAKFFNSYLRASSNSEMNQALRLAPELRDLSATDNKGGFHLNVQLSKMFVTAVNDFTFVRNICSVEKMLPGAKSLGVVSETTQLADADWTSEVGTSSDDTAPILARKDMTPTLVAKLVKVSRRIVNAHSNIESYILSRMAYKFAVTIEKGFLVGDGTTNSQPLGVFAASASGVPTSRDVSTDNSTTAFSFDGIMNAQYNLKEGYLRDPSCRWIFHRDAFRNLAKLKTDEGQYLWSNSTVAGAPPTLGGIPVLMSEYAPNTFTTGLYAGIIGAFKYYMCVESSDLEIQNLVELYAANHQVGYIGRQELQGAPVLGEAFSRVKLS